MEFKNKIDVKSIEFKDNLTSGQTQGGMELSLKDGRLMCKMGETEVPFTGMIEIRDNVDPTLGNVIEQGVLYVFKDGVDYSLRLSDTDGNREISGGNGGGDISGSGTSGQIPYFTASDTIDSIAGTSVTEGILNFQNGVKLNTKLLKSQSELLIFDDANVLTKVTPQTGNVHLPLIVGKDSDGNKYYVETDLTFNPYANALKTPILNVGANITLTGSNGVANCSELSTQKVTATNITASSSIKVNTYDVITRIGASVATQIPYYDNTTGRTTSRADLTFTSIIGTPTTYWLNASNINVTGKILRGANTVMSDINTNSVVGCIPFYSDTSHNLTRNSYFNFDNSNQVLNVSKVNATTLVDSIVVSQESSTIKLKGREITTNIYNDSYYLEHNDSLTGVTWFEPYSSLDLVNTTINIGENLDARETPNSIIVGINNTIKNSENVVIIGNGNGIATIEGVIQKSTIFGNNTIINRKCEMVRRIGDDIIREFTCNVGNVYANPDIKSEITFKKKNVANSDTIYTLNLFADSIVNFEIFANFYNSVTPIRGGVKINGCIYVDTAGNVAFLPTNNTDNKNDYDLITTGSNNYVSQYFATGYGSKDISINISLLNKYQLDLKLTSTTTLDFISGVITIVESRF